MSNTNPTFYGELINLQNEAYKLSFAAQTGIKILRTSTTLSVEDNQFAEKRLKGYGFQIFATEQWETFDSQDPSPKPFATDIPLFKDALNEKLDVFIPDLAVFENEENNDLKHSGTAEDYINELAAGIEICHARGIKVTNGGLTSGILVYLYYQYLVDNGRVYAAKTLAAKAGFNPLSDRFKEKIIFGRTLLDAYKTLPLDFVNFHWYEPLRMSLDTDTTYSKLVYKIISYLELATGKKAISNEIGMLSNDPVVFGSLLHDLRRLQCPYIVINSGDGVDSQLMYNEDFTLNELGLTFQNFVK